MANRKQYIEQIIGNMYAIKRTLVSHIKMPITPSQMAVLAIVMKQAKIGNKEIARELGVTSSAATQLIDELVGKGYLKREGSTRDRRALLLTLSDPHKKKMIEMRTKSMKRFALMFDALTDDELAQYAELNKKIAQWLRTKSKTKI